jgi:hypothetical protein
VPFDAVDCRGAGAPLASTEKISAGSRLVKEAYRGHA